MTEWCVLSPALPQFYRRDGFPRLLCIQFHGFVYDRYAYQLDQFYTGNTSMNFSLDTMTKYLANSFSITNAFLQKFITAIYYCSYQNHPRVTLEDKTQSIKSIQDISKSLFLSVIQAIRDFEHYILFDLVVSHENKTCTHQYFYDTIYSTHHHNDDCKYQYPADLKVWFYYMDSSIFFLRQLRIMSQCPKWIPYQSQFYSSFIHDFCRHPIFDMHLLSLIDSYLHASSQKKKESNHKLL
jgi:hypothetical protein